MTDQSKPTTDMPHDLVPAAPTDGKEKSLNIVEKAILRAQNRNGLAILGDGELETIRAALQENTAPDDLVMALKVCGIAYGIAVKMGQIPDDDGSIIELVNKALAAHKAKTQGAE